MITQMVKIDLKKTKDRKAISIQETELVIANKVPYLVKPSEYKLINKSKQILK